MRAQFVPPIQFPLLFWFLLTLFLSSPTKKDGISQSCLSKGRNSRLKD